MDYKNLPEQLEHLFSERNVPSVSARKMRRMKADLLAKIEVLEREHFEKSMITGLKRVYIGYNEVQKHQVRQMVFEKIRSTSPRFSFQNFVLPFLGFSRKALAMGFAFVLVFSTLLGPLQGLQPLQMVSLTQAAYMECSGSVYLNGELCSTNGLHQVMAGDQIQTQKDSLATLFYNDYTVVRLNDSSTVSLDSKRRSQIHLQEGNVWLHTPGDVGLGSFQIDTSVLRAKLPQGSAGVSTRGTMTQLYTTTAAVEVQIDSAPGSTELMTVAPEKQLLIRKSRLKARVQESPLGDKTPEWVKSNQIKDEQYVQLVKQKTLENTIAGAGVLPGSVQDSILKITQSARTVLTWDQQTRLHRQLTELDELFSESLVLLEKGDITTAESTFKAYQEKFTSLVAQKSDTIRLEISAAETDSFGQLLQYHARLLAPFSPEDKQYLLKQSLEQLAVQIASLTGSEVSRKIVADSATNKFLLAYKSLSEGNLALAEEILLEASEFTRQALPSVPLAIDTSDLTVLNTLAAKSEVLSPLVRDIKRMKLEQVRSLTPQNQIPLVVSNYVAGTAYKPVEGSEVTESPESMVKVVGQAVKEESSL